MREQVAIMLELAAPAAATLGTEPHLRAVEEILSTGNGSTEQRRIYESVGGHLTKLQKHLLGEARDRIVSSDFSV